MLVHWAILDTISALDPALVLAGNLSGGEVNLAYELLNIQQSIDGLMSILSLFIIHVALVHVRIE